VEPTTYDQVRYPGKFYPQSSADRLATLGRLCGLTTRLPARCRLLELGCGDGGNLIPQALAFPQARFVGVDLAASAVEDGRRTIAALGLVNIELHVADIAGFDAGSEHFDYITAHGVLSWVPEPVREALLALCGRCLAPQGVAYVSYSALPGAYLRSVPRDLMRFHTRAVSDPLLRPRLAREAIDFVLAAVPGHTFTRELMEREMAGFEGKDYFLLHDLLADENEPLYFLDFVDAAGEHDLQFLAEADFGTMSTAGYPPPVQRQLDGLPNRLEREQYIDFIQLRRFRQTLLCRRGAAVDVMVTAERLADLHFSTHAQPLRPDADAHGAEPIEFRHPYQGSFRAAEPVAKALALVLARGDRRGMDFAALTAGVAQTLGRSGVDLLPALMSLHDRHLVAIHASRWDFCVTVGPRPRVNAYARWLAARGSPVVNAAHGTFALPTAMLRRLVQLLDGTRSHDDLLEALAAETPPAEQEALTTETLRRRLQLLADNALLVD
jgi:SAM-dependent methyltransferase